MKTIHLICNAHIDPMWQWKWEEGAAVALSTFRCAASFCEENDGFIFNHNEALLYKWVEEYEPELFARIQRLVVQGKWHIMGGWFLQPDCNLPNGDSLIRQIEEGRRYFQEKFGVRPTTAINFDSFGHSRGLVQLLTKSGYDSYIFMRPDYRSEGIGTREFLWEGYDGSRVVAHNIWYGYGCGNGGAAGKLNTYLEEFPNFEEPGVMLWGVGDHGGGASRTDIRDMDSLAAQLEGKGIRVIHSTPEDYFAALRASGRELPVFSRSLRKSMLGCYTSQMHLKQANRRIEHELAAVEVMAAAAELNGLMEYPREKLAEAARGLMTAQFHDALPGSSIETVETALLNTYGHSSDLLSHLRARLFFALASAQPKTPDGEIPILVYNPLPYETEQDVVCEFTLADHHWDGRTVWMASPYDDKGTLPAQLEKEDANNNFDWRKRLVFRAKLAPNGISRFNCRMNVQDIGDGGRDNTWKSKPAHPDIPADEQGLIRWKNGRVSTAVSTVTGRLESLAVDGVELLGKGGVCLAAYQDTPDSWGHDYSTEHRLGEFHAATPEEMERITRIPGLVQPVRVIENGPVRCIVECVTARAGAWAVWRWYFSQGGDAVDLSLRLFTDEKNTLYKLCVPAEFEKDGLRYTGQDVFGRAVLDTDGIEQVHQAWCALSDGRSALAVASNSAYASHYADGVMNITLVRTPAYCCLPIQERDRLAGDRFSEHMDGGQHLYRFSLFGGKERAVLDGADRRAQALNALCFCLPFFPSGGDNGEKVAAAVRPAISLPSNTPVVLSSMRKMSDGSGYLARLYNPTPDLQTVTAEFPVLGSRIFLSFQPYELLAVRVSRGEAVLAAILDETPHIAKN